MTPLNPMILMKTFALPLRSLVLLLLLLLLSFMAQAASPVLLHVTPDGNDAWSGKLVRPNRARTDGPLGSLAGARDAVRRLKQQGLGGVPVRVSFAAGTYSLTALVEFVAEDSGTEAAPVVYEAAPGAKPLFTGGEDWLQTFRLHPGRRVRQRAVEAPGFCAHLSQSPVCA